MTHLQGSTGRAIVWPWRRYHVGIDGKGMEWGAGNLTKREALSLADYQSAQGNTAVVMRRGRKGRVRVVETRLGVGL